MQPHPALLLAHQTTLNTLFNQQHAIQAYFGKPFFPGTQQTKRRIICIDSSILPVNAAKLRAPWVPLSEELSCMR